MTAAVASLAVQRARRDAPTHPVFANRTSQELAEMILRTEATRPSAPRSRVSQLIHTIGRLRRKIAAAAILAVAALLLTGCTSQADYATDFTSTCNTKGGHVESHDAHVRDGSKYGRTITIYACVANDTVADWGLYQGW